MRARIADLYSGCGGFSLGAELAGCRSLVAVDIDPTLQSAYRLNFPHTKAVQQSVADLGVEFWKEQIGGDRLDGIIGGPPCQGFSRMGHRKKDDPRNDLLGQFYRQVDILRPKFFIMENVEGILDEGSIDILHKGIDRIADHYTVLQPTVVNAADFGAPTNRKRVVVVGYDPKEVDAIDTSMLLPNPGGNNVTVKDAISDLPAPIPQTKNSDDFGWSEYPQMGKAGLSDYAKKMRKLPSKELGDKIAKSQVRQGLVSGLFDTCHTPEVAARYSSTPQGRADKTSKAHKLAWDGLCPTLRAGTGPDKGSHQAVRPLHPEEGRVITVREAARLQGFPDWFLFHPAKWHSFRMIGNSVSPIVSHKIVSTILPCLTCLDEKAA